MASLQNIEIEYKYSAEDISKKDFIALAKSLKPTRTWSSRTSSSVDHYFTKKDRFMRFRTNGENWELTTKLKLNDSNNKVRTEINIALAPGKNFDKAKAFSAVFGLEHDFTIIKDVEVFWYDNVVLSYYTCFNESGKELNTFLEIECDEEHEWESEQQAFDVLAEWEKRLGKLGINPYKRIRKSLFEFYTNMG